MRVALWTSVTVPVVQAKTYLSDVAAGSGNGPGPPLVSKPVTMLQPAGRAGAAVVVQKPPGSGLCGSRPKVLSVPGS